eukprot:scaffold86_cov338-Pavlova_lutheri.AAC.115
MYTLQLKPPPDNLQRVSQLQHVIDPIEYSSGHSQADESRCDSDVEGFGSFRFEDVHDCIPEPTVPGISTFHEESGAYHVQREAQGHGGNSSSCPGHEPLGSVHFLRTVFAQEVVLEHFERIEIDGFEGGGPGDVEQVPFPQSPHPFRFQHVSEHFPSTPFSIQQQFQLDPLERCTAGPRHHGRHGTGQQLLGRLEPPLVGLLPSLCFFVSPSQSQLDPLPSPHDPPSPSAATIPPRVGDGQIGRAHRLVRRADAPPSKPTPSTRTNPGSKGSVPRVRTRIRRPIEPRGGPGGTGGSPGREGWWSHGVKGES